MPSAAVSALGHTLEPAHGFEHWRVDTGWKHDYAYCLISTPWHWSIPPYLLLARCLSSLVPPLRYVYTVFMIVSLKKSLFSETTEFSWGSWHTSPRILWLWFRGL